MGNMKSLYHAYERILHKHTSLLPLSVVLLMVGKFSTKLFYPRTKILLLLCLFTLERLLL